MTFVTLSTFEYAVVLAIRFDKGEKIDLERNSAENKVETCNKVDRLSLKVFVGTYIISVGAYFVVVTQI